MALLLAAAIYEVRFSIWALAGPQGIGHTALVTPFALSEFTAPDSAVVNFLSPPAVAAGLRPGDTLLALQGKPLTGTTVYGQALKRLRPGDVLAVTLRSPGESTERVARITMVATRHRVVAINALYLAPVFCLFLGLWVASVRPSDLRAWLLLLLLLGFTGFLDAGIETWEPGLREFGAIYRGFFSGSSQLWLVLLGIYFPEPFPRIRRRPWWYWMAWLLAIPLVITIVLEIVEFLGQLEDISAMWRIDHLFARYGIFFTLLSGATLAMFVASMVAKWRAAISRDSRRRLHLLLVGGIISFIPFVVMRIIAQLKGVNLELYFPKWSYVSAYLLVLLFFPLTLAYTVVVQRAMDVRVVIRQGLQYALARKGVVIIQFLLIAAVTFAAATSLTGAGRNRPEKIAIIALGVAAIFLARRGSEELRRWIDHRFFRDAYNTEQILTELGERVRTIVETRPLLEIVIRRISESLHVPRVAVLIDGSGPYRPAYTAGFPVTPQVAFPDDAAIVQQLRERREPLAVYADDPNSWVNRAPAVSQQERANLAALSSELLLPLAVNEKLLGFLSLGQKLSEEPYSGTDLRLLKSVAAQTGLALEVARLTTAIGEEIAQRERLNREVEIAREVQEHLFPQTLPAVEGLDYCGRCRPALGVGGDYFDFVALAGGKLGIAIGDVSGKGISAALMMASLQAALRSQAAAASGHVSELIAGINRLVFEASSAERYATLFYAEYDSRSRLLTYVNAGHNPPLVLRRARPEVVRLEAGGTVVGLLREFVWQQATFAFAPGDLLVAFTDGISEAMNPQGDFWGEDRLVATLHECARLSAADTLARVMAAADGFAGDAKQSDDMTLIVARVAPSEIASKGD